MHLMDRNGVFAYSSSCLSLPGADSLAAAGLCLTCAYAAAGHPLGGYGAIGLATLWPPGLGQMHCILRPHGTDEPQKGWRTLPLLK